RRQLPLFAFNGHDSPVTRHSPLPLRPFPAGYSLTPTVESAKTEQGPISTSGPSLFSLSPNQAIASDRLIRFSPPAVARPLTVRSRPEALNASGSRRAGRIHISQNACSLVVAEENAMHGRGRFSQAPLS